MTHIDIKQLRQARGMTQIEVAIAVGVSVPAYRLWEAGGTKPTRENETKLLTVLGGPADEPTRNKTTKPTTLR